METIINLILGEYIRVESYKSEPFTPEYIKRHKEDPKFGYFTKARNMEIWIYNSLTGGFKMDERNFNILVENKWCDFPNEIQNTEFIDYLNTLVVRYMLDCHDRMKQANPDYGYGLREGKIPLLTHHFFEYVEQDFKISNSSLVTEIKDIQKDMPLYLDVTKYNL